MVGSESGAKPGRRWLSWLGTAAIPLMLPVGVAAAWELLPLINWLQPLLQGRGPREAPPGTYRAVSYYATWVVWCSLVWATGIALLFWKRARYVGGIYLVGAVPVSLFWVLLGSSIDLGSWDG